MNQINQSVTTLSWRVSGTKMTEFHIRGTIKKTKQTLLASAQSHQSQKETNIHRAINKLANKYRTARVDHMFKPMYESVLSFDRVSQV